MVRSCSIPSGRRPGLLSCPNMVALSSCDYRGSDRSQKKSTAGENPGDCGTGTQRVQGSGCISGPASFHLKKIPGTDPDESRACPVLLSFVSKKSREMDPEESRVSRPYIVLTATFTGVSTSPSTRKYSRGRNFSLLAIKTPGMVEILVLYSSTESL